MDQIHRAYAVLGLKPGTSFGEVRRRYRALARRWHPDRHAGHPQNQAEAGQRMRRFNGAYQTLAAHLERARPQAREDASPAAPAGRPLTREEIDSMVETIGYDGPVEWMLDSAGWVGSAARAFALVVVGIAMIVRGGYFIAENDWQSILQDRSVLMFLVAALAILVNLLVNEVRKRWELAHLGEHDPED